MRLTITKHDLEILKDYCLGSIPRLMSKVVGEGNFQKTCEGTWMGFKDNGANILAVAHTDTVGLAPSFEIIESNLLPSEDRYYGARWQQYNRLPRRSRQNIRKAARPAHKGQFAVISPSLDDRLGVWMIGYFLLRTGLCYDILLTDGEERGKSSASYFKPPRQYNWIFEFDRRGTEVVMYQFENKDMKTKLEGYGYHPEWGSFSDISYLDDLGCKAFNFGVGYHNEHTTFCHALIGDIERAANHFLPFYDNEKNALLPHDVADNYSPYYYYNKYDDNYGNDDYYYGRPSKATTSHHYTSYQTWKFANFGDDPVTTGDYVYWEDGLTRDALYTELETYRNQPCQKFFYLSGETIKNGDEFDIVTLVFDKVDDTDSAKLWYHDEKRPAEKYFIKGNLLGIPLQVNIPEKYPPTPKDAFLATCASCGLSLVQDEIKTGLCYWCARGLQSPKSAPNTTKTQEHHVANCSSCGLPFDEADLQEGVCLDCLSVLFDDGDDTLPLHPASQLAAYGNCTGCGTILTREEWEESRQLCHYCQENS